MSKSVGNVVNPDVVIDAYGADSLRLFEMFLGPLEAVKPWSEKESKAFIVFFERHTVNAYIPTNIPVGREQQGDTKSFTRDDSQGNGGY